ncbi:MAG: MFS transporter [Holosporales bacterium]|nr:MFS transporter [Holosporales bacterium]
MMVGYAASYFVRLNLSFAMLGMESDLGYSKGQLGRIVSVFGVIYGLGKFISGILGDRSKTRTFMSVGLLLAAVANILMARASNLYLLIVIWAFNSCFQSTGAPSCAKMLAHWFSPKEIGTRWAIWSSSQQLGLIIISLVLPTLIAWYGWRFAFWGPGVFCIAIAAFVYWGLRDEPQSVGLPSVEKMKGLSTAEDDECAHLTPFQVLVTKVLRNKIVWAMCLANFFVYFVRMGFLSWGPTFLKEAKGCSLTSGGNLMAIFNAAGALGAIAAGRLSDTYFKGYRGRAGFCYMAGLSLSMLGMLYLPFGGGSWLSRQMPACVMFLVGFFVAGPQAMVGVAAVDMASKRAAGAASGLTGSCGYIGGTTLAGAGIAYVASGVYKWNGVFMLFLIASVVGACCFLFSWNVRAKSLDVSKPKLEKDNQEKAA